MKGNQQMTTVHKKAGTSQRPATIKNKNKKLKSIRIYFVDNGELRDQIESDSKKFGMSLSIMANLYIRAGRPTILNALNAELQETKKK
jgi:hypothetical protein